MPSFFSELKRRNVLRAGVLYIGALWALAQGISQLGPSFGAPDWFTRWFVIAGVIGFPFWLVFAWFYELTPEGLKRESEIASSESMARSTGKKLDRWIIAVLTIAVVLLLANTFVLDKPSNPGSTGTVGAAASAKSIAVLPFVNMSGDPKQDYFSDGVTEEILDALSKASDLKVAARTSAFAFKGKAQDVRKIGEVLGVATVLEGSVQTAGEDVRITAQLIDARSGFHLWSDHYDRKLTRVFAVEDEISAAIAGKLQAQLGGGSSASVGTGDAHAHELYLRGLTLLAARGPGLRDAADTFRQAVAIDPNYAQAWAALAQAEVLLHTWYYDSEGTAMHDADGAVRRALELDPNVANAHVALGIIHDERWEWADAEREFRRALELAPNDAEAIEQYGQFLHAVGQLEAALPVIEHANLLDPLSGLIGGVHAQILKDQHRCEAAKAQIERTLAVVPDSRYARGVAVRVALVCKQYSEAEAQARRFAPLAGRDPDMYAALLRGVAEPTHREDALRLLRDIKLQGIEIVPWRLLLGDREGALGDLETRFSGEPVGGVAQLWDPVLDPLRDDPRFKKLLAHIGVPYQTQPAGLIDRIR